MHVKKYMEKFFIMTIRQEIYDWYAGNNLKSYDNEYKTTELN